MHCITTYDLVKSAKHSHKKVICVPFKLIAKKIQTFIKFGSLCHQTADQKPRFYLSRDTGLSKTEINISQSKSVGFVLFHISTASLTDGIQFVLTQRNNY